MKNLLIFLCLLPIVGTGQDLSKKLAKKDSLHRGLPDRNYRIQDSLRLRKVQTLKAVAGGVNIFDKNDPEIAPGFYVNHNDGALISTALSYTATGFMPVEPGEMYYFATKQQIAWYDAQQKFISGDARTGVYFQFNTAPAGAYFCRASITGGGVTVANYQVVKGFGSQAYAAFVGGNYISRPDTGTKAVTQPLTSTAVKAYFMQNAAVPMLYTAAQTFYIPVGKEITLYPENIIKYYTHYRGKAEITGPTNASITSETSGRNTKITPAQSGTYIATLAVVNEAQELIVNNAQLKIVAADTNKTTAVKVLNFGDSFTKIGAYTIPIQSRKANTNLTFLGIRQVDALSGGVRCEGRGGWTLADYNTARTDLYNPFMQPVSTYKYWGNTTFWINATSASPAYDYVDYPTAVKSLFNSTTGFLAAPAINDLMYDNSAATYKFWNGAAWTSIAAPTFAFNFALYRTMWGIAQPDIFHFHLGTNDFPFLTESGAYNFWNTSFLPNLWTVINSVQADSPNAKIILGIPASSGRQGADGTLSTERRNRNMWVQASLINLFFANRETAQKIYIADYRSTQDRQYGFASTQKLPFAEYSGTYRENVLDDFIHPLQTTGFRQMGWQYMGLIQYLR